VLKITGFWLQNTIFLPVAGSSCILQC